MKLKSLNKYYPSNIHGSKIKNAITGKTYDNCYVGSESEKNFYRVIDSTGNYNIEGSKTRGNKSPNKLFFESYEEFENFYKIDKEGGYRFLYEGNNEEYNEEYNEE